MFKNPEFMSFWAYKNIAKQKIEMILRTGPDTKPSIGALTLVPYEEGLHAKPMIELGYEEAIQLMDELWSCGIRPSNGNGNEGQLQATKAHLEDMRKIALGWCSTQIDLMK